VCNDDKNHRMPGGVFEPKHPVGVEQGAGMKQALHQ
jgi:hypothetical protein